MNTENASLIQRWNILSEQYYQYSCVVRWTKCVRRERLHFYV